MYLLLTGFTPLQTAFETGKRPPPLLTGRKGRCLGAVIGTKALTRENRYYCDLTRRKARQRQQIIGPKGIRRASSTTES